MIWVVPLQRRCSLPSYEIGRLDAKLEGWLHDRIETQNDPYWSSKSATQNHLSKDNNIPRGYREGSCRHTSLQQKLIYRKIKQNPLERVSPDSSNAVQKLQIFQVFQIHTVEANWKFHSIKERKLCYNCFKKNHFTTKCKSKNII